MGPLVILEALVFLQQVVEHHTSKQLVLKVDCDYKVWL